MHVASSFAKQKGPQKACLHSSDSSATQPGIHRRHVTRGSKNAYCTGRSLFKRPRVKFRFRAPSLELRLHNYLGNMAGRDFAQDSQNRRDAWHPMTSQPAQKLLKKTYHPHLRPRPSPKSAQQCCSQAVCVQACPAACALLWQTSWPPPKPHV